MNPADPLRGILAGALAGLAASALMNGLQALVADTLPESDAPPATELAADAVAKAATGAPLHEGRKAAGGQAVHYAFGTALGALYGGLAEIRPDVTRGSGTLFGGTAALVFDEIMTPIMGIASPPSQVPAAIHVYALASHLVFGAAVEGARRVLRG